MTVIYATHNDKQVFMMVDVSPAVESAEDFIKPGHYKALRYKALIDTGATNSCISPKVVNDLRPPPKKGELVCGLTGMTMMPTYKVRIGTPLDTAPEHSIISKEGKKILSEEAIAVFHHTFVVSEFAGANNFDVLLGMDFLGMGSLKIEGNSTTSFAF